MYTQVYVLQSPVEIYKGLALEQALFRECAHRARSEKTQDNILFLWRSTPAVVIGRNQNPLLECNLKFLVNNNIDLARRDSGGGAVYLDAHNLNFCCISLNGDRISDNFSFVLSVLSALGIECKVDKNNNIRYKDYKISGSAYRISKSVHLHHFTLLLSTDLETLYNSLSSSSADMVIESKGITSKKDKVENISLNTQALLTSIVLHAKNQGAKTTQEEKVELIANDLVSFEEEHNRLVSDAWVYERTPKFMLKCTIDKELYYATIKKGALCAVTNTKTSKIVWEGHIPFFLEIMRSSKKRLKNSLVHDIIKEIKYKIIGETI